MKTFDKVSFKGTFRNYQQRVLDNSGKYLLNGKINIVAAPGSGKTVLGLELIKRLNAPTIVLSPTTTIKYQWGDRFKDAFLDKDENFEEYFSYDLHEITLINSITYQALHSIMNKLPLEEEGVVIDYSDLDIFELVKKYKVKTICLDEAHHLQNEWQKSLETFIKQLGHDVKIIALTATPPYDAGKTEWSRYEDVCGQIDEEIFVPELVKEGTLCPHQDYIYFNYPSKEETVAFSEYKEKVLKTIEELRRLDVYQSAYHYIEEKYNTDKESLFEDTKSYIALLIVLNSLSIQIDPKIIKSLTLTLTLPEPNITFYERAFQFLLDNDEILTKEQKEEINKILKKYSTQERGKVNFTLKDNTKHKLISSVGKLNSIAKITEVESNNLGDKLRMLILTDYIKKDSIKDLFSGKTPLYISVVTIFEILVKSNPNYKMGVLSGNLVILPTSCKEYLKKYKCKTTQIGDTNYSEFSFSTIKNKDKVDVVSTLFEKGIINIIIGTKALLGEGWDSPCINTLILASFVGSFMLSNQMRGRAIRIDKNNPNKVSNIWHLVTLEPEYIFEEKLLKAVIAKKDTDFNQIQSYDYDILERRFDCFVGPNYETGEVESGIDRVTIIRPPFNKDGIESINEKMLTLAKERDLTRSKWGEATQFNFKLVEEMEVPEEKIIRPFAYVNGLGIILCSLGFGGSSALITGTLKAILLADDSTKLVPLFMALIASVIVTFVFGFYLTKFLYKIATHISPRKNMTHLAKALLKTLQDIEKISHRACVKVRGDTMCFGISLDEASIYEQNIFNTAITEMLSPIDNPKYLLIIKRKAFLNYELSYSCPTIIGQRKELVELFSDNLKGRVADFEIVYTRNNDGRKLLIKCRKRSFLTQNEKFLRKKKRISRYE